MSTYKNLIGKNVNFLSTDPDNDSAEGQIWYNSTSGVFKDLLVNEAWSSSGNMINQRAYQGSAGSVSAGLVFGGSGAPSYPSPLTLTEEYNGSGFSVGGAMNVALAGLNGSGTQTAALAFGGFKPPSNTTADNTEEYDGSSWTAGGALGTARFFLGSAKSAPQTAGLAFGGNPGYKTNTEEYNGSSWTAGGALTQGRNQFDGAGTQTAGLAVGGQHSPPFRQLTDVEEYDGSSWTSVTGIPTATEDNAASGLQTAALTYGGSSPSATANSFAYNGSTWTATPSMANARQNGAGTGTGSSSALSTGGGPPSNGRTIAEEYNRSANVITGAAWAAGGNLGTARNRIGGAGTQTAGLAFGGSVSPGGGEPTVTNLSESYNGSSWSEGNNLGTSRYGVQGCGPQTAALAVGGVINPNSGTGATRDTEEYDGTSWTAQPDTGNNFYLEGVAGIQTAAVIRSGAGGPPGPAGNYTEEYNGSSWSANPGTIGTARYAGSFVGTLTASIYCGGEPPTPVGFLSETYDGTNFSTGPSLVVQFKRGGGAGTQTDALIFAPSTASVVTQQYNGTSWVTSVNNATERNSVASSTAATASAALMSGGGPGVKNNTEEFTGETSALNIKTITTS